MGISPIEYRPWQGKRTAYYQRFIVISKNILTQKLKSKWILALIIIGVVLVHVFPIIFYTIVPHEKLTAETMVGEEPEEEVDIIVTGDVQIIGKIIVDGSFEINGTLRLNGSINLNGNVKGTGVITGNGSTISNTTITENGSVTVTYSIQVDGEMEINGSLMGLGYLEGELTISGSGVVAGFGTEEDSSVIIERQGGYLKSGLFIIFTILLASLICADLIAEDLADNSFILYFSRPLKPRDYIGGKILGALWVLIIFCFIPPIIFCLAVMGTQSSGDYGTSLNVFGSTIIAGLLTSFIFIPYGMVISSVTKRKAYATVGIFMSFFVLTIVGSIFQNFNRNWALINPINLILYSYDVLFGFSIPEGINSGLFGLAFLVILIVPLVAVYLRIQFKAVGK